MRKKGNMSFIKNQEKTKRRAEHIKKIREKEQRVFMQLGAKVRAYFFTGILVTAPVSITFYMAYQIIMWIDNGVEKLLPPQIKEYYNNIPFTIPGLGVLLLLVALILIGMFAAGFVGSFFVRLGDWIVKRMPVISSIYSLLKQVFETLFSNKNQSFRQVVLLEYPRKGIWILGFVSGNTEGEVKSKINQDMLNIFIPTTPNPTSGFLIFVPKEDVIMLDMSVEDGLKFVVSCGIVLPKDKAQQLKQLSR